VWLDNGRHAILQRFVECDFETRTSFVALLDFSSLLTKISFHFCVVYLALLKVIIPTNNQQFLELQKTRATVVHIWGHPGGKSQRASMHRKSKATFNSYVLRGI